MTDRAATMASATHIALLRGINVGGHNRIPMAGLRELAGTLGWQDVRSYIQSGNLVFRASGGVPRLEVDLEAAIERQYNVSVPVIVRDARDWAGFLARNPFPQASMTEPKLVMLAVPKESLPESAAEELQARATLGESVRQTGHVLWIHYAGGVQGSRLSPGLLDRVAGSAVTTRNWRTVRELARMAGVVE